MHNAVNIPQQKEHLTVNDSLKIIENYFPFDIISKTAAKEKYQKKGNISTMHTWFARRPLVASRTTIFAALMDQKTYNDSSTVSVNDLITQLAEIKPKKEIINQIRQFIRLQYPDNPPKVLDPFAGGGSIPLEALRLGCEVYANDLNPVASLIELGTLVYPFDPEVKGIDLAKMIKFWFEKVESRTFSKLKDIYQTNDSDGWTAYAYRWARSITCPNPECSEQIPLIKNFWLATGNNRAIALKIDPSSIQKIKIIYNDEIDFNPAKGTLQKGKLECPFCHIVILSNEIRKKSLTNEFGIFPLCVVLTHPKIKTKHYRLFNEFDLKIFDYSKKCLQTRILELEKSWSENPIPFEIIPTPDNTPNTFFVHLQTVIYGMRTFRDFFLDRQLLTILEFIDAVKYVAQEMMNEGISAELTKIIITYHAFIIDKIIDKLSVLCRWIATSESVIATFSRQALIMVYDFAEFNPIKHNYTDFVVKAVSAISAITEKPAHITHVSATALPYQDKFFDAIITDPPYYDNVPYSDLSDYFYVFLKRSLKDYYPELFSTPLSPKMEECVDNSTLVRCGSHISVNDYQKYGLKDKQFFEITITRAFNEISRTLKDDGICVIVFAHKTTDAWETILNAIMQAKLYITSSWPVKTELKSRLRANNSAALASSIYMVCRKRTITNKAYFYDIKSEIIMKIEKTLDIYWNVGIRGGDFFISSIGPAMELFGKYSSVETLKGLPLTLSDFLKFIRTCVNDYVLKRVLNNIQVQEIDSFSQFYLLWRWSYGQAQIPYDEARKFAQALGVELSTYWSNKNSIVVKNKNYVRLLTSTERKFTRINTELESKIDIAQYALSFWANNNKQEAIEILEKNHQRTKGSFWEFIQALAEILPNNDQEKRLLQEFLYESSDQRKNFL